MKLFVDGFGPVIEFTSWIVKPWPTKITHLFHKKVFSENVWCWVWPSNRIYPPRSNHQYKKYPEHRLNDQSIANGKSHKKFFSETVCRSLFRSTIEFTDPNPNTANRNDSSFRKKFFLWKCLVPHSTQSFTKKFLVKLFVDTFFWSVIEFTGGHPLEKRWLNNLTLFQ